MQGARRGAQQAVADAALAFFGALFQLFGQLGDFFGEAVGLGLLAWISSSLSASSHCVSFSRPRLCMAWRCRSISSVDSGSCGLQRLLNGRIAICAMPFVVEVEHQAVKVKIHGQRVRGFQHLLWRHVPALGQFVQRKSQRFYGRHAAILARRCTAIKRRQ
jgi:hypothetical protein